jgi:CHRD domain
MKHLIKFLAIPIIIITIISCKKDDDPVPVDPNVTFKATLNGANELPTPNPSTATGSATAIFNKDTKILTLNMTYTGVVATAMHIHKGSATAFGGVQFGLGTAPFPTTINYTSPALPTSQEDSLMNNLYYLNIHSAAYGGGEIRGQLLKQ